MHQCMCPECWDKIGKNPEFVVPKDPNEIKNYEFMFFKIKGEIYWGMKIHDMIQISDQHPSGKFVRIEYPLSVIESYAYKN